MDPLCVDRESLMDVDLSKICGEPLALDVDPSQRDGESDNSGWKRVVKPKFSAECGVDLLERGREPLIPPDRGSSKQDEDGTLGAIEGIPGSRTEQAKIIVNRVQANAVSIRASVTVYGREFKAVVDSGAEVSIMSCEAYRQLPKHPQPTLKNPPLELVVADQTHRLDAAGVAELDFTIEGHVFHWSMYIAPISDSLLLGCDILDAYNWSVNSRLGLLIRNLWVPCEVTRRPLSNRQVVVRAPGAIEVPAEHEVLLTLQVEDLPLWGDRYAVMEPIVEDHRGLLLARCLVDTWQEVIPVRMINVSSEIIRVQPGYPVGELQAYIDEVQVLPQSGAATIRRCSSKTTGQNPDKEASGQGMESNDGQDIPTEVIENEALQAPEHLRELYIRTVQGIQEAHIRQELLNLLQTRRRFRSAQGRPQLLQRRWAWNKYWFCSPRAWAHATYPEGIPGGREEVSRWAVGSRSCPTLFLGLGSCYGVSSQGWWLCTLVCRLQIGQWSHGERCVPTSQNRYVFWQSWRGTLVHEARSAVWILADSGSGGWYSQDGIYHKVRVVWIHHDAIWALQCDKHLPALQGINLPRASVAYSAHLPGWHHHPWTHHDRESQPAWWSFGSTDCCWT